MRVEVGIAVALFLACPSFVAYADDQPPLFSGPQVGEKLPGLKATLAYGNDAGTTVDFVELAAGRPTLLVIVNGANRPAANLTRGLMNFAEMRGEKLFAGIVYLDADLSAAERYLHQSPAWWSVGPPIGVSLDGAEGPGSYGLNRNVNLTVLVADKGVVTANFPLIQPGPIDGPKILKEVVALAGGRVPTLTEISFLSIPTYRPRNAPWRASTSDAKLRELICATLAATDDELARLAIEDVEQYIKDDKDRQAELGGTLAAFLTGYGRVDTAGQVLSIDQLRAWRKQYAPPDPEQKKMMKR